MTEHVTDWLEFHDSIWTAFDASETGVVLLLDAYVHRWALLENRWRGTGWIQGVRIVVRNAVGPSAMPVLPMRISDGWLHAAAAHNGLLRLPMQASGVIRIGLRLNTADVVEFTGSSVHIETTADARYVEELPEDIRPQDPD